MRHPILDDERLQAMRKATSGVQRKLLREELWETYAPAHWQGGACPHRTIRSGFNDGPWPLNLSWFTLSWVVEHAAQLDRMLLLCQESHTRAVQLRNLAYGERESDEPPVPTSVIWHVSEIGMRTGNPKRYPWRALKDMLHGERGRSPDRWTAGTWFGRYEMAIFAYRMFHLSMSHRPVDKKELRGLSDGWLDLQTQLQNVAREANRADPIHAIPPYLRYDVELPNWIEPLVEVMEAINVVVIHTEDGAVHAWLPFEATS